jgi:hypothetical protein
MFLGGLVGAICVLHVRIEAPLVAALVVLIGVGTATVTLGRNDPTWSKGS